VVSRNFHHIVTKKGNREQGTGNREQGTGNREQGTGNREQGTDRKHSFAEFRTSVKKKMFLKDA
jgi:hypothetical protein